MRRHLRLWFIGLGLAVLLGAAGATGGGSPVGADDAVRIEAPAGGARVVGQVEIRGRATTADPARFSFYRLYYGQGSSAAVLRPVGPASDRPVESGSLGIWDTSILAPGEYLLMLTVYDTSGNRNSDQVTLMVDLAPTPTPLTNQPPTVFVTPAESPTPGPEGEAVATPVPQNPPPPNVEIPAVDVPAPNAPAPLPDVPAPAPANPAPPLAPIQSDPVSPALPPPPAPVNVDPAPTPSFNPAPAAPPPIVVPPPPPPPVIPTFEPPPALPTIALPTPFGL